MVLPLGNYFNMGWSSVANTSFKHHQTTSGIFLSTAEHTAGVQWHLWYRTHVLKHSDCPWVGLWICHRGDGSDHFS
jgi:hypothetical protein